MRWLSGVSMFLKIYKMYTIIVAEQKTQHVLLPRLASQPTLEDHLYQLLRRAVFYKVLGF